MKYLLILLFITFAFQDNGNWQMTDDVNTWNGEWITQDLMKVTGTDDSCFIVGQNGLDTVQLDCNNLQQISVLISNL